MNQSVYWLMISLMLAGGWVQAQRQKMETSKLQKDTLSMLLRIYEDNDFLNIRGQGTDDAYTNGTRIDFFYLKKHASRSFIDKLMPKAEQNSIDVYGWGIMQLMFTPNDLTKESYQPDDYPYSGALIISHSLYSYDPFNKYDFQTELVFGAMGPIALAAETQ